MGTPRPSFGSGSGIMGSEHSPGYIHDVWVLPGPLTAMAAVLAVPSAWFFRESSFCTPT